MAERSLPITFPISARRTPGATPYRTPPDGLAEDRAGHVGAVPVLVAVPFPGEVLLNQLNAAECLMLGMDPRA